LKHQLREDIVKKSEHTTENTFIPNRSISLLNYKRKRNKVSGLAAPKDVFETKDEEPIYRDYCDQIGNQLASMNVLLACDYGYNCYLIERFSPRLSMLAQNATAISITSNKEASLASASKYIDFTIYSEDDSADAILEDVWQGASAVFLGNSLPFFTKKNLLKNPWNNQKLLAVVYRDEIDRCAA